jgi:hypothetical protein
MLIVFVSVVTNDTHTLTRAKMLCFLFAVFLKSIYFNFGGESKFTEGLMINKPRIYPCSHLFFKEYELE